MYNFPGNGNDDGEVFDVASFEKELGTSVKIVGFVRFELGEGVEKKDDDFAAEVAAQIKT